LNKNEEIKYYKRIVIPITHISSRKTYIYGWEDENLIIKVEEKENRERWCKVRWNKKEIVIVVLSRKNFIFLSKLFYTKWENKPIYLCLTCKG